MEQSSLQTECRAVLTATEELRLSRAQLAASSDKYAFLYDFAPVGYLTLDRQGRILTVNLTGSQLLGIEPTGLKGRRLATMVNSAERSLFDQFFAGVFAGENKETCRLEMLRPDRQPLYVRIEAKATSSGDECLVVLLDITERRQAQRALAESEYNLAKAQSMTHVGSWSFNPVSGEVKASDELLRIMRLGREQMTPDGFASVIHPDDHDAVMEHLRRGIHDGLSYEIEHRLHFTDGATRWVYTIVEPALAAGGAVTCLYGTTQDITERKQAEVELGNKSNELQAIFDSIGDGIVVYDHRSRVQHHNAIAPQLFSSGVCSGDSCRVIFHPDQPSAADSCPVERATAGERVDNSLVIQREGGKTRYLEVCATPIRDAVTGRDRALVFFRDVSKKRLQEMHLIQAEKMSSIGVLATGIAHEINNPIASVAGYAEALQRRLRDEPLPADRPGLEIFPNYLGVIVREAYRCKGIIDQLLTMARKSDNIAVEVDINAMLLEIAELLRHHPGYRQVRVVTTLCADLPRIVGDPSGLRQVFLNLLVNAFQAIEECGRVEVESGRAEEGRVFVRVRDSGPGIPPDAIDKIWDPFFTTKEVGRGVGLGLAISYDIVKRHGGELQVSSSPGAGAEFTVLLPLRPCLNGGMRPAQNR